jgi:hypothetical protein
MASNAYKVVRTYLHKEKDYDIIQYIEDLPNCLRQKYLREALSYYKRQLEKPGVLAASAPANEEHAPSIGGVNVLKKVSL